MIYTDTLSNPIPTANISHFGGSYGRGGYLLLHTTASNNPDNGKRWDNNPEDIATIAAWAEANGYDITESRDGYGAYRASLTHRETQAASDALKTDMAAIFAGAERGHVRMGDLPEGGRSRNKATGCCEAGVSVFSAEIAQNGQWRPILDTPQMLASYLSLIADDRPAYRVYGDVIGTGGDGEPLMRVSHVTHKICINAEIIP
jgi:hypothetical protein